MILTCQEWEDLPIGKGDLSEVKIGQIHTLAERAAKQLKLPSTAILTRTSKGLKAGQVVGTLVIPNLTIEILPKIDGENSAVRKALIRMLSVVQDLRVSDGELADLDTQRNDLLELLIRLFSVRLLAAVRRGLPRRYLTHEDDLRLLRGKLIIKRQMTNLAVRSDLLACRFDELSEDTPLNRIVKAAVLQLLKFARSATNIRLLTELAAQFEFVGNSSDPLRESVLLDRTNIAFHDLYKLARQFLSGYWQSTTGGHAVGFTLLFAMNELFEKFIGRSLKRALSPNYEVLLQHHEHHALTDAGSLPIFALRPDAVIEAPERTIVLDTKWKRLKPEKETLGILPSDIYQVLTYAWAYNATRLILLYPWHCEIDLPNGLARRWTVTGSDCPLDIATVDVGHPDEVAKTLRDIVCSGHRTSNYRQAQTAESRH